MTVAVVREQERLWRPNFTMLFASRFAKVLADNVAAIAFVWLLIQMGGTATSTALLYTCTLVPQTVLSSLVSPMLRKGKLTHWMFASDLIRAVLVCAVPFLADGGMLTFALFFVLVFLQSATGAFYNPASIALLPKIVQSSKIQQANALMQSSNEVVTLLGLAGAGVFITMLSVPTTLFLTSALFLGSALLVIVIRPSEGVQQKPEEDEEEGVSYWQRIRAGFSILKEHKMLYALNVFALFLNIGIAPWTALAAIFVAQDLQGDANMLTLLRASSAVGAFLMGLVLTKLKIRRFGAVFILAGILEGVMFLVVGGSPWIWLIVLACFGFGMCQTAINVPEIVIIQTTVPSHQQAQVYSVIMTLSVGFLPFAYLAAGALADHFGSRPVLMGGGLLILCSGLVVRYFTKLATLTAEE